MPAVGVVDSAADAGIGQLVHRVAQRCGVIGAGKLCGLLQRHHSVPDLISPDGGGQLTIFVVVALEIAIHLLVDVRLGLFQRRPGYVQGRESIAVHGVTGDLLLRDGKLLAADDRTFKAVLTQLLDTGTHIVALDCREHAVRIRGDDIDALGRVVHLAEVKDLKGSAVITEFGALIAELGGVGDGSVALAEEDRHALSAQRIDHVQAGGDSVVRIERAAEVLLITTNELHYLNNSQQVRMIFFLSEIV